jgi:hypothetical protein
VDGDGDGYGTAESAKFCSELSAQAPAGYASYTGDCCDLDSGANPGFSATPFLEFPDACGSYDWNCNGSIALEYSKGDTYVVDRLFESAELRLGQQDQEIVRIVRTR